LTAARREFFDLRARARGDNGTRSIAPYVATLAALTLTLAALSDIQTRLFGALTRAPHMEQVYFAASLI